MVLVMESDGSLTPSRSQDSFARNYNDGIGQGSAADELAILGMADLGPDEIQMASLARPAPLPRVDVLAAIEDRQIVLRDIGKVDLSPEAEILVGQHRRGDGIAHGGGH